MSLSLSLLAPIGPCWVQISAARPRSDGAPDSVHITFQGVHNDKMAGFYRSKTDTQILGVTQFESTDARRAFPCFDEPALKATFQVRPLPRAGSARPSFRPTHRAPRPRFLTACAAAGSSAQGPSLPVQHAAGGHGGGG